MALKLHDKDKLEVILRLGACCLLGFSLSIAYVPQIVPPALRILPAIVAATLSVTSPSLLFAIGLVTPIAITTILVSMAGSTMLLRCAVVSDGLFVGIFAVYAFVITSLYAGKKYSKTAGVASAYIAIAALNGLTYRPMVQMGGTETVRLMWTEKGLENPQAVWRNFLISYCWGVFALAMSIGLPPFRTSRSVITHTFIPHIFVQINSLLGGDSVQLEPLVHSWNSLGDEGSVAMVTVFEPRLIRSWSEDLVTPLKELAAEVDHLILKSLLAYQWKLEENADAKDSDLSDIERLQEWVDDAPKRKTNALLYEDPEVSNAYYIFKAAKNVQAKALAYMHALNHPTEVEKETPLKQRVINSFKAGIASMAGPMLPTMRIGQALLLPFQPKKWNIETTAWALEMTAGYVALISMEVYWDGYADFRISPVGTSVGAVYAGWNLVGYAFAIRPTLEGTIKKGLARAVGTCIGAFSAWLGVIVCSWSYDDNDPINPYGFIAWLTIFSMIFAWFFGKDAGVAANLGGSKDHGFIGEYCALTQALVGTEIFAGAGDKNGITVNRIVATITGVIMAGLMMLIPPHVKGGDPKHAHAYLKELDKAFDLLLNTFVDREECSKIASDDFRSSLLSSAVKQRKYAFYVWNDANTLRFLPLFKLNEEIKPLMEAMAVTEAMIGHLSDALGYMISSNQDQEETLLGIQLLLKEERKTKAGTMEMSDLIRAEKGVEMMVTDEEGKKMSSRTSLRIDDLVGAANTIQTRLGKFEDDFASL